MCKVKSVKAVKQQEKCKVNLYKVTIKRFPQNKPIVFASESIGFRHEMHRFVMRKA